MFKLIFIQWNFVSNREESACAMDVLFNWIDNFFFAFILSNFLLTSHAHDENTIETRVTIPQGTLQGTILKTHHNRSISAFMGIPFAQPPTGNLRYIREVLKIKNCVLTSLLIKNT